MDFSFTSNHDWVVHSFHLLLLYILRHLPIQSISLYSNLNTKYLLLITTWYILWFFLWRWSSHWFKQFMDMESGLYFAGMFRDEHLPGEFYQILIQKFIISVLYIFTSMSQLRLCEEFIPQFLISYRIYANPLIFSCQGHWS